MAAPFPNVPIAPAPPPPHHQCQTRVAAPAYYQAMNKVRRGCALVFTSGSQRRSQSSGEGVKLAMKVPPGRVGPFRKK